MVVIWHRDRYADVLLVFAEAENELNPLSAAAFNAINQVRARANLPPLSVTSQDEFRKAVWLERQHELYGEFQSKFDLVREGRWLTEMNKASSLAEFSSTGPCRPRQAYQIHMPLPNAELAGNQLITQNPGY